MLISQTLKIDEQHVGQRLDIFLSQQFPSNSRSFYSKNIKEGHILVNNTQVKSGYLIQLDDTIGIQIEERATRLEPINFDLDIVFEDEHLLVVNKPAGLTVHAGKGTTSETLVNALLNHTRKLALLERSDRPGIVHRLDKNTSGLIVVAKTDTVYNALRKQFDDKTIKRTYWGLAWGVPKKPTGTVHTNINRSRRDPTRMSVTTQGREAITHYEVLREYIWFSLLKLDLETGRTHQIRVHIEHIGHPLVGDPDYNGRDSQLKRLPDNLRKRGQHLLKMLPYQFLHAKEISFIHPVTTQPCHFETDLPLVLKNVLEKLPLLFLLDSATNNA